MLESLTQKINQILRKLSGKGKLSEQDIDATLREIRLALLEADVNFRVVKEFLAQVRTRLLTTEVLESLTPVQLVVKFVHEELTSILGKEAGKLEPAKQPPSTIMLVGLQGSGKTTTAAKLALHLKRSGQQMLLVAADTRRPAAIEQLVILAKDLNLPVHAEDASIPPVTIAANGLKKAREMGAAWVIIDTQGRLHIDEPLMKELVQMKAQIHPSEVLLVVDAMTGQDAVKVAEDFNSQVGLTGLILTKMDGDARGGAALSIRHVTGIPIKFVGTGEKADALELFHPDRLASRILGMGDMLTLIEKAEETFDEQQLKKLEKKIRSDTFDLNDFLEQLRQLKKMGPISRVAEMLPGVSGIGLNKIGGKEEKQLKKLEAMISSMTLEERRDPAVIGGSRRRRIARGSGTSPQDINQLLNQFQQVQKLMRMVSKGKLPHNLPFFNRAVPK